MTELNENEKWLVSTEFGMRLLDILHDATKEHEKHVESGGLRSGNLGPLDNLILALDSLESLAVKARTGLEEGDD